MSPTIIEKNNELYLVIGASGGSRIITSTNQVILNILDFQKDINEAISLPRIHCQLIPNYIEVESNYPNSIVEKLRSVGNKVYQFFSILNH